MSLIRHASERDIKVISDIEERCFPSKEAASLETFEARYKVFAECFFVLERDGVVVGQINGCINDKPELPDALYQNARLHCADGKYQTVFGLAVSPDWQGNGFASLLLEHFIQVSKHKDHTGMVLTCKEHLIFFYQKHGFQNMGLSDSTHGGARWYKMFLEY